MHLPQYRNWWWALVNLEMNFKVPEEAGSVLTS
jgi:hypothetical protein